MMRNIANDDEIPVPSEPELNYGDFGFDRYAWELTNLRPLRDRSFKVHGRQFLFNVDIDPKFLEAAA